MRFVESFQPNAESHIDKLNFLFGLMTIGPSLSLYMKEKSDQSLHERNQAVNCAGVWTANYFIAKLNIS